MNNPTTQAAPANRKANPADARRLLTEGFQSYEAFCGLLDIVPKGRPRQKFYLNPIQRIYCAARTPRDVILKARQIGMTTEEQARDVWHFLTVPGARVTMMVQSIDDADSPARKAKRVFDTYFESLAGLGLILNFGKSPAGVWTLPERDAVLRIVEAGASKAAAQKKGRGDTVTRLHATELAFWEFPRESLLAVESSVVAPELGGEVVYESTPNGVGGKFYDDVQAASRGAGSTTLHFYPWFMDPQYRVPLEPGEHFEPETDREKQLVTLGVSQEQLKWYRRKVQATGSQADVDQEYPSDPDTCFLLSGRPFFSHEKVEEMRLKAMVSGPVATLHFRFDGAHGELRVWELPKKGSRYVVSLDPSEGTGGDPLGGHVMERGTGHIVATLHGQFKPHAAAKAACYKPPAMVANLQPPHIGIGYWYNTAMVGVERNNHGHAVLQAIDREHHYPNIFRHHDQKPGWINNEVTRTKALSDLDNAIREGSLTTRDLATLGEMRTFITNARGRVEAARGSHDDLVLALAIGRDILTIPEPPRGNAPTHSIGIL